MFKRLIVSVLTLCFATTAAIAQVGQPIANLPAATSPLSGTEKLVATQGIKSVNITPQQIASYVGANNGSTTVTTLENAGGKGDAALDSGYSLTNTPTDNLPALRAIIAAAGGPSHNRGADATKLVPTIVLQPNKLYYFSSLDEFHSRVVFLGNASATVTGTIKGSSILFPRSTGGPIFENWNTTGRSGLNGSTDLGTSEGSIGDGVNLVAVGSGGDTTRHCLQLRIGVQWTNSQMYNCAGDGLHAVGYTNGTDPYGLVIGSAVDVAVHDAGDNCAEIGGSDAASWRLARIACHQSVNAGILSYPYFAIHYDLGDVTGYGRSGVEYNGTYYQVINGGCAACATLPTDRTVWIPVGTGSPSATFPTFVSGTTYPQEGAIWDSGNGSTLTGAYVEELSNTITGCIHPGSLPLGGTITNFCGGQLESQTGLNGAFTGTAGMGAYRLVRNIYDFGYPLIGGISGGSAYSIFGYVDPADGQLDNHCYANTRVDNNFNWCERFNSFGDLILAPLGQKAIRWHSGTNNGIGLTSTTAKGGRYSIIQHIEGLPGVCLGGASTYTESGTSGYASPCRLFQMQTAKFTAGQFTQGEHNYLTSVTTTTPEAQVFTVTGAIGTGAAWAANTSYPSYLNTTIVTNDGGKTYVSIVPPLWAANTAYATGALITGQTGQGYKASSGGTSSATGLGPISTGTKTDGTVTWAPFGTATSASSGGPTGTGTAIIDNTALWSFAPAWAAVDDYLYPRAEPVLQGYLTGAGGAVTQLTSRTTGVTIAKPVFDITLFSAAGSATPATMTITNSLVDVNSIPRCVEKSGTDLYQMLVTAVGAGSFNLTFFTTGGTTTEQPVFKCEIRSGAISLRMPLPANDNAPMRMAA